jgi:hypothetical protein
MCVRFADGLDPGLTCGASLADELFGGEKLIICGVHGVQSVLLVEVRLAGVFSAQSVSKSRTSSSKETTPLRIASPTIS